MTADDTTRVDALRHTDDTPDAERLARISNRNRRLAAVPFETHGGTHGPGCIPCELVRAVGDVSWLLERLGKTDVEWAARWYDNGEAVYKPYDTEAQARHFVRLAHERGVPKHMERLEVVHALVGEWKPAEQQPEDGDRG